VGIIMLIIVLQSLGLSPQQMSEGIALILGVDRILDMCRTSCNVTGDCAVATIVAHTEGELLSEEEVKRRKTEAASHGLDEHPLASRSADAGAMALGEERR
jgi:Na+/H+-dicarboxylate symporter